MLRVLTYHRVVPAPPPGEPVSSLVSASPEALDRQMRHVTERYDVVSLDDVLGAFEGSFRLPRRAVLVTFDDAYHDFAEHAWPVLARRRVPVTLFVPTAYPGDPSRGFWWDRIFLAFTRTRRASSPPGPLGTLPLTSQEERLRACSRFGTLVKSLPHAAAMALVDELCEALGPVDAAPPRVLTWDELRELAARGVRLGAHSRHHPLLTRVEREEARFEVASSKRDLEREIGGVPPVFCYPAGAFDREVRDLVEREGFRLAFTTLDGHNDVPRTDPLLLCRTNVTPRTTPAILRLRLLRTVSYLDRWRHRRARGA